MPHMYAIEKGTSAARCPKGCGAVVFWGTFKRAGGQVGSARIPIDTDTAGGSEPDSLSGGLGINHFEVCPKAD